MRTMLVVALLLVASSDVVGQQTPPCGPRDALLKQLAGEFQEQPVGIGLTTNGSVLELLTSDGGSWTLMVTQPSGLTCLVAGGEHWQTIARKVREEDS